MRAIAIAWVLPRRSTYPAVLPQYNRDCVYSSRAPAPHPGDAIMAISGHTTDQAVIATMTVGTVLGVFAVAARLFTRIVIVRKAGWDDAIICAGCVSSFETLAYLV